MPDVTDSLLRYDGNLVDDVRDRLAIDPDAVAFSRHTGSADWQDVTIGEFDAQVRALAKGLVASGVQAGDRVALLSRTRYEWTLVDYAVWYAGAVTVPIYETSSVDQIAWILEDSGAVATVVETPEHAARVAQAGGTAPAMRQTWTIDADELAVLATAGESVDDAVLEERYATMDASTLATIVYTSGTTGRPRGCMLTHGNFRAELGGALETLPDLFDADGASTLLFLPLAHVFARIIQVGTIRAGARLGHSPDIKDLVPRLGEFQPTFVLAVPRVFEKVFNSASQKAHAEGKGKIFDQAVATAIEYSRALDAGKPGLGLRLKHGLFDKLVYGKLRAALGGQAQYAISGGAALGERLGHFFRGVGVTILEGYGLTETTAALAVNPPHRERVGSVGLPISGAEVRIAADGELQCRGPQVFQGYWRNEKATAAALDADGWFGTGDLGEIDADGFIRITGRKKEIIVTAGGKNVAPAVLEDRVRANPYVSQCLAVGDGKPFIAALVTIDAEAWTGPLDDPALLAEVQKAVDDANTQVSKAESIRKFLILDEDWTEENGYLTPSFKVKRNRVLADMAAEVESLYTR
ncbi:long-chain fatty acid--CoA ligase [Aeromicrobium sp. IC_218]|nr:long-chain fatty acid--CoA ligase [Aeromicrobium sp. IC_218]